MRRSRRLSLVAALGFCLLLTGGLEPSRALAQAETGIEQTDRIDPRNTGQPRYPTGGKPQAAPLQASFRGVCLSLLGTFGPGNWPAGCWRPYAADSPFNQPIPANPRLDPRSSQIVSRLLGFGSVQHLLAGQADTPDDYSHPTYYSQLLDPVYTLHCYEASWGTCPIEGERVSIPDAARPAAGGDAHLTVVNQITGREHDLYKVRSKPSGGGTLEFRWGGSTSINGSGLGSAATASQVGNLAGIIRAQELEAGEIKHAIFMVVKCDSGEYVYPAGKAGRRCSDIGLSNVDAPPMGARFQLRMSDAEIDALSVPAWKKTIFRAMARYGMIMGDTGSGSWAIQAESGSTYTSFGYEDRLVTYARSVGAPFYNGRYIFNVRDGVDWASRLRVVHPALESAGTTGDPLLPPISGLLPSGGGGGSGPPQTGSPAPAPTTTRTPASGARIGLGHIGLSGSGRLTVKLSCRAARCKGRLTLTSIAKRPKKPVRLTAKAFNLAPGRAVTLRLRLSRRGRALLRRNRRVRAKATAVAGRAKVTRLVTLRARRPSR